MKNTIRLLVISFIAVLSFNTQAAINWNDSKIRWYGYEEGIKAAKQQNKNIILIVYAEWCGVCKKYSKMFRDRRVVSKAENVIFIRLDQDKDSEYIKKYSIDGQYVPRTYLLNTKLEIMDSPYKSKKYQFYLPPGKAGYLSDLLDKLK